MSRTLRTTWPTFRTRIAIGLDDTALGQARVAPPADDDVVVDAQVEQMGAFHQLARQAHVFAAGRGIATRMVVKQDHRGGGLQDRRLEDLARMHEAGHSVPSETIRSRSS